ncbi:hypothetical protein C4K38_1883 [Pseudomonas chlororaphis subsp. piscium]|nr:hypothetical protein C4K38_1883 [Pseudomonas chlororaphis subsp. piscium]
MIDTLLELLWFLRTHNDFHRCGATTFSEKRSTQQVKLPP